MSDLEKTIKIRAFSSNAMNDISQNKPAEESKPPLEFTKPGAPAEGEPSKFIEFAKVIEQLGKSLKDEQLKSAELTRKLGTLEEEQAKSARLAQRVSELEEELKKSLESAKKTAELEAQVKELTETLGKIANMASVATTPKRPGQA
jgi:hypothetical protein